MTKVDLEMALACISADGGGDLSEMGAAGELGAVAPSSSASASSSSASAEVEVEVKDNTGSTADVLAFDLFKNACDLMEPREFATWYKRHVSRLFEPATALKIKHCLDKFDPRLNPDFIFPEGVGFLPGVPTGSGIMIGSYRDGFGLESGSPELSALTDMDTEKHVGLGFYENLLESKISDAWLHLVYKRKMLDRRIHPLDYFFQTIVKIPQTGRRMVIRVHMRWLNRDGLQAEEIDYGTTVRSAMCMQDVSTLYADLLCLPPLPY